MPRLDGERLSEDFLSLASGRKRGAMSFLGVDGVWRSDPGQWRDRASCELWFRLETGLPEAERAGLISRTAAKLCARTGAWSSLATIFPAGGLAPERRNELMFHEALSTLIGLEAFRMAGVGNDGGWNLRLRQEREFFSARFREIAGALDAAAGSPGWAEGLLGELGSEPFFGEVALIIADEEAIWRQINQALGEMSDPRRMDESCCSIQELLGDESKHRSLPRPALWLLDPLVIPVSSGIPYQAAHLLGKLSDPRTADGLAAGLSRHEHRHTELRACLAYALGSLADPTALGTLAGIASGPPLGRGGGCAPEAGPRAGELRECVWALGKLGAAAAAAVPSLAGLSGQEDDEFRCALAWALGRIGVGALGKELSVQPAIETSLEMLAGDRVLGVHQEAAQALAGMGRTVAPRLDVRSYSEIPVLSLKPSSTGLFEVSETLYDMMDRARTVTLAVTGDSGTGKTYFCRSLLGGFGRVGPEEIRYLARDVPEHNDIFNRMLGLEVLRGNVAPEYYLSFPEDAEEEDPDVYFGEFWNSLGGTRLVILDGWRDDAYFQKVLERFFRNGRLDILLTFHAGYSTRRLNLERREGYLEHVRSCLSYVEGPEVATKFHLEGRLYVYGLNNSIGCRLDDHGVREVFGRRKVTFWSSQVSIGPFLHGIQPAQASVSPLEWTEEPAQAVHLDPPKRMPLGHEQTASSFRREANRLQEAAPNLLQTVHISGLSATKIFYFGPGQIVFAGSEGEVGVLSGFNDRVFASKVARGPVGGLAVLGTDLFSMDESGRVIRVSLLERRTEAFGVDWPGAQSIASDRFRRLAVAHADGSISLWDRESDTAIRLESGVGASAQLGFDLRGRLCAVGRLGAIAVVDIAKGVRQRAETGFEAVAAASLDSSGSVHIAVKTVGDGPRLARCRAGEKGLWTSALPGGLGAVRAITPYPDGRLVLGTDAGGSEAPEGTLHVVDPRESFCLVKSMPGHGVSTSGCLASGPRIVTCGQEKDGSHSVKIWGTEGYVARERETQDLLLTANTRPPYYHSLF